MNRIHILPDILINQIAAGEVIERPVSVVKELVENSIDADARFIEVEIQGGGRSLIKVTDDGIGMSHDDAILAFERHATSKISSLSDLFRIQTLGFRGEALPSIASVSRVRLLTREREINSPHATEVIIEGGKILDVHAASHPAGTTVEVRHLFFNLPARRKFLKSEETEKAHIYQYLTLVSLAYPEIGFQLIANGQLVWRLPPLKSSSSSKHHILKERIYNLFSEQIPLLEVELTETLQIPISVVAPSHPNPCLKVWGLISAPGYSRASPSDIHIFVNRRLVTHRGIFKSILSGYRTSLMKDRYPFCVIFLELDPYLVDVNVHPAKKEIRFRLESQILQLVEQAIRSTLGNASAKYPPPTSSQIYAQSPSPAAQRFHLSQNLDLIDATAIQTNNLLSEPTSMYFITADERLPTQEPVSPLFTQLRLVGTIGGLYLVFESEKGIVLVDQHAAHERVLFEQMETALENGTISTQDLLTPELIEISPTDWPIIKEHLSLLNNLGFRISHFGGFSILIEGLPAGLTISNCKEFFSNLIQELQYSAKISHSRFTEAAIAKIVCKQAVKARNPLRMEEISELIRQLRSCKMPYTCPHGRPTFILISFNELEKRFGRRS